MSAKEFFFARQNSLESEKVYIQGGGSNPVRKPACGFDSNNEIDIIYH